MGDFSVFPTAVPACGCVGGIEDTGWGEGLGVGEGVVTERRTTGGVGATEGRSVVGNTGIGAGGTVNTGSALSAEPMFNPFKSSSGLNFDQNGAAFEVAVSVEGI